MEIMAARLGLARMVIEGKEHITRRAVWDWEGCSGVPAGWIPVQIEKHHGIIRWMKPGARRLFEPFFQETVHRFRFERVPEFETELTALEGVVPLTPAGIIFHVSRCGSTLVLNALKAAERVVGVGEAGPFQVLMQAGRWATGHRELLGPLTRVFACYQGGPTRNVIIKCAVEEIAALPALRKIWPEVPCVVLIRNPIEVIVSNAQRPPRWTSAELRKWFGDPPPDLDFQSSADYIAWVTGQFCSAALAVVDSRCWVVDYASLSLDVVRRIARYFNLVFSGAGEQHFQEAFRTHAKSRQVFTQDAEDKCNAATEAIKQAADKWVTAPYSRLVVRARADYSDICQ